MESTTPYSHVYCVDKQSNNNVFENDDENDIKLNNNNNKDEDNFTDKSYYIGLDNIFQENAPTNCHQQQHKYTNHQQETQFTMGFNCDLYTPTNSTEMSSSLAASSPSPPAIIASASATTTTTTNSILAPPYLGFQAHLPSQGSSSGSLSMCACNSPSSYHKVLPRLYDDPTIQEIRVTALPVCEYYPPSSHLSSVHHHHHPQPQHAHHAHHSHHVHHSHQIIQTQGQPPPPHQPPLPPPMIHITPPSQHSEGEERYSTLGRPKLPNEHLCLKSPSRALRGSLFSRIRRAFSNYLPFIIVSSILSVAVALLISASIIYFQIPTGYKDYNCERVNCSHQSTCIKDDNSGQEKCICQEECPLDGITVCGTDGLTYQNECLLHLAACKSNIDILIAYHDTCDVCKNVHCKYGAICSKGSCICPTQCPSHFDPVCSSEGLTYTNECHLRHSICSTGIPLTVSYYGECQDTMRGSETSELIGGAGYIQTCDPNTCLYGGTCDYDKNGVPQCLCSYSCPSQQSDEDQVCGSDGRLYENECKLQEEACSRQQDIKPENRSMCEESKIVPCNGQEEPLPGPQFTCSDPLTTEPLTPTPPLQQPSDLIKCPQNSYCHRTHNFAKCCPSKPSPGIVINCTHTEYGCCPDGITPAPALNNLGCPSLCNCNRYGSYVLTCDPKTSQCHCKPGVGGLQCDRCEPGYWGLHKIAEGNAGCIPCSCNLNGSVRDDCEQMTGRCICKHGLQGMKCNVCPKDSLLTPDGCTHVSLTKIYTSSCSEIECKFGAVCRNLTSTSDQQQAQCFCDIKCSTLDTARKRKLVQSGSSGSERICASDGVTYPSECGLRLYACRMQKNLTVLYQGECSTNTNNHNNNNDNNDTNQTTYYGDHHGIFTLTSSVPLSTIYSPSSSSSSISFTTTSLSPPSSASSASSSQQQLSTSPSMSSETFTLSPLKRSTVYKTTLQDPENPYTYPSEKPSSSESSAASSSSTNETEVSSTWPTSYLLDNNNTEIKGTATKPISIPSFFGQSSIEMPRLNAYTRLSIEIEFLTFSENGLLVYNGQTSNGEGDFVSISIKGGYIEFRYNLGSGMVILRSSEKIATREKVKLVAKRYLRDGLLTVDSQPDVAGSAEGDLKNLDLAENLYIGQVMTNWSKIYDNIGTMKGFIGCLYSMRIGRNPINLTYPGSNDILRMINVIDCSELPCFSSSDNGESCSSSSSSSSG